MMNNLALLLLALLGLLGCSTGSTIGVVAPVDGASGYLLAQGQPAVKARTTVSRPFDIKAIDFVVVFGGTYYRDQLREFKVFPQVIAQDELGRYIVAAGLQDEIQAIRSEVDLNRLYRRTKPFLVLKVFTDQRNDGAYLTMVVVDPKDLTELFRAETLMQSNVRLRTDQEARYPLFNSLRDWLRTNGA